MLPKSHKRTLSNPALSYADSQLTVRKPSSKSPKTSFTHHARQFSQNIVWPTTNTDNNRINTENAYNTPRELKVFQESTLKKISSQVKQFENFYQQNLNHLSERSLKHINYDTLDHLASYLQSPRSIDDFQGIFSSFNRVITEPPSSDRKSSSRAIVQKPPVKIDLTETNPPYGIKEKRPLVKTPNMKELKEKIEKLKKPGSGDQSIFHRKTSSLVVQNSSNELKKEKKSVANTKTPVLDGNIAIKGFEQVAIAGLVSSSFSPKRNRDKNMMKSAISFSLQEKKASLNSLPSPENKRTENYYNFQNIEDDNVNKSIARKESQEEFKQSDSFKNSREIQYTINPNEKAEDLQKKIQSSNNWSIRDSEKSHIESKKTGSFTNSLRNSEILPPGDLERLEDLEALSKPSNFSPKANTKKESKSLKKIKDLYAKRNKSSPHIKTSPNQLQNNEVKNSSLIKANNDSKESINVTPILKKLNLNDIFVPSNSPTGGNLTERVQSPSDDLTNNFKKTVSIYTPLFKSLKASLFEKSAREDSSRLGPKTINRQRTKSVRLDEGEALKILNKNRNQDKKEEKSLEIKGEKSEQATRQNTSKSFLKFNFNKKRLNPPQSQAKKGRKSTRRYSEFGPFKTQIVHHHDFAGELDKNIKAVLKNIYASMKNTGSMSKLNAEHRKSADQTGISQFEELLKQEFDEESLKKGSTNEVIKFNKLNTFESEISVLNRMLTRTSSGLQSDPTGTLEKEIQNTRTTITKPYPVKNWIITVNINPPIEEASPHMEESVLPYPSLSNHGDPFELANEKREDLRLGSGNGTGTGTGTLIGTATEEMQINTSATVNTPSISSVSRIQQYKFELNTRKHIEETSEEEDPQFEEISSTENVVNDQSFRKKAESIFKYEILTVQDFRSQSLMARIKNNFFNFVENLLWNPTNKKSHNEFLETYRPDDIKKAALANSGGFFRYQPKVRDIVFQFLDESNFPDRLLYCNFPEDMTKNETDLIDDEKQETQKTKERELKPFMIDIGKSPYMWCLMTRLESSPILISMSHDVIQQIKDPQSLLKIYTLHSMNSSIPSVDNDCFDINGMSERFTDFNWNFVRKIMFITYEANMYGLFENKIPLNNFIVTIKTEDKANKNPAKLHPEKYQRRRPTLNKQPSLSTTPKTEKPKESPKIVRRQRTTKTLIGTSTGNLLLKKATTKLSTSTVINEREEKEEHEDKDLLTKNIQIQHQKPRRYSKTTVKPNACTTVKEQGNLEKLKTAQTEASMFSMSTSEIQAETLPMNPQVIAMKGRTITIASEEDTTEMTNQLQIPVRPYVSNQFKHQSSLNSNKEENKSKLSVERQQTKNIFTSSNTLNSSTHKSASPNSDSQARNSGPQAALSNTNNATNGAKLVREPSYSTLVPPDLKETKTETNSQRSQKKLKESSSLLLKPPPIQASKTIIGWKSIIQSLPIAKKIKETAQTAKKENGPKVALFGAIYRRKQQELQEMLDLYPREVVNIKDDKGNTLLIVAAQAGDKNVVQMLIERKIDINAQNNEGNTALHFSLHYGHDNITDLLIANGAKQGLRNNQGKIPWEMVNS